MSEKEKILFDPGYAPIVIDSLGQVGYTYYMFNAISDLRIKRINFPQFARKIEKHLEINIAFYLGCLLWASYIKQFENYELVGNQLLGEVAIEEEYTSEIDFLLEFVEKQFPRDYKYYLNKFYKINEKYIPILKTYREFLVINKGFTACSNTSQILIPSNLKKIENNQLEELNLKIQNAIKNKNVVGLFENYNLIF